MEQYPEYVPNFLDKAEFDEDYLAREQIGRRLQKLKNLVEQSDTQAVYWFKKSAEQGNAKAQYNLGLAYYYGKGVKMKFGTQAAYWLEKACENGNGTACKFLGKVIIIK